MLNISVVNASYAVNLIIKVSDPLLTLFSLNLTLSRWSMTVLFFSKNTPEPWQNLFLHNQIFRFQEQLSGIILRREYLVEMLRAFLFIHLELFQLTRGFEFDEKVEDLVVSYQRL